MTENKKYSRNYKGESGRIYRYDFEHHMLQWLESDKELAEEFGEVVSEIGLSLNGWNENKKYYIQMYDDNLSEELGCLVREAEKEFGGMN